MSTLDAIIAKDKRIHEQGERLRHAETLLADIAAIVRANVSSSAADIMDDLTSSGIAHRLDRYTEYPNPE